MAGRIAFFDVDHTLTRRSTGYRFAVEAVRRGLVQAHRLAAMPLLYIAYRLGRPGPATFDRDHAVLRGIRRELLEEAARAAFESRIAADLYPAALALVASLKAQGIRVFLATSSFDLVVRPVAERLGAAGMVASRLEFRDGISTGRFEGPPAFGTAKFELAMAAAAREGVAIADCSFYSDSIHDLPLLLAVGEPVAVNPDLRLAREARERGWRTLSFR
jgi:HAD superfamily hydrolase (TIGR01490 family)